MIERGELPAVRFGRRVFVDADGFERYLAEHRTGDGSAVAHTTADDYQPFGPRDEREEEEHPSEAARGPQFLNQQGPPMDLDQYRQSIGKPPIGKLSEAVLRKPRSSNQPKRSFADDLANVWDEDERRNILKRRRLEQEKRNAGRPTTPPEEKWS